MIDRNSSNCAGQPASRWDVPQSVAPRQVIKEVRP